FFSSRHDGPVALRSFPARRSSDLLAINGSYGFGNGWAFPAGPLREPWAEAIARADAVCVIGTPAPGLRETLGACGKPLIRFQVEDRESTRLNSSHVKSSYAVVGVQ